MIWRNKFYDEMIEEAQLLIDNEKVKLLSESNDLALYEVDDHRVEIFNLNTVSKLMYCSCVDAKNDEYCIHMAAACLAYELKHGHPYKRYLSDNELMKSFLLEMMENSPGVLTKYLNYAEINEKIYYRDGIHFSEYHVQYNRKKDSYYLYCKNTLDTLKALAEKGIFYYVLHYLTDFLLDVEKNPNSEYSNKDLVVYLRSLIIILMRTYDQNKVSYIHNWLYIMIQEKLPNQFLNEFTKILMDSFHDVSAYGFRVHCLDCKIQERLIVNLNDVYTEQLIIYRMELTLCNNNDEEIVNYAQNHLDVREVRIMFVEYLVNKGKVDEAIEILKNGMSMGKSYLCNLELYDLLEQICEKYNKGEEMEKPAKIILAFEQRLVNKPTNEMELYSQYEMALQLLESDMYKSGTDIERIHDTLNKCKVFMYGYLSVCGSLTVYEGIEKISYFLSEHALFILRLSPSLIKDYSDAIIKLYRSLYANGFINIDQMNDARVSARSGLNRR